MIFGWKSLGCAHTRLSSIAYTCCSVKPSRSTLFEGQTATQVPQPMHRPWLTRAVRLMMLPFRSRMSARSIARVGAGPNAGEAGRAVRLVDFGDFRLAGELLVAEHHQHLAGRRSGLGDRLGNVLRTLARSAHEHAGRVGLDRPQLRVRFGEEAELVVAHVELLGQLLDARRPAASPRPARPGRPRSSAARRPACRRRER